jgi:hypothetical protein
VKVLLYLALAGLSTIAPATPDTTRLQTGRFIYSDQLNGKELGRSQITITRQDDGAYCFTNEAIGHADQTWTALASTQFAPISAKLSFGSGEQKQAIFDIHYREGRVRGFRMEGRGENAHKIVVDDNVPSDIIDQRIDWAAVMASTIAVGGQFGFKVYDPKIKISNAVATVEARERIHVPAGDFDTVKIVYRIAKKTGTEQYRVFTNIDGPRMLIREDFPDGTSSQLVKAR